MLRDLVKLDGEHNFWITIDFPKKKRSCNSLLHVTPNEVSVYVHFMLNLHYFYYKQCTCHVKQVFNRTYIMYLMNVQWNYKMFVVQWLGIKIYNNNNNNCEQDFLKLFTIDGSKNGTMPICSVNIIAVFSLLRNHQTNWTLIVGVA